MPLRGVISYRLSGTAKIFTEGNEGNGEDKKSVTCYQLSVIGGASREEPLGGVQNSRFNIRPLGSDHEISHHYSSLDSKIGLKSTLKGPF